MRRILAAHSARYPDWEPADLYKLIHQAALGSGHAVADEAEAGRRLIRELSSLGPGPEEPLADPISPDGGMLRIHLRPFARLEVPAELLLEGFLRTAREYRGTPARLAAYAEAAVELAGRGGLGFPAGELSVYLHGMLEAGCPAVHHSSAYRSGYSPAYRVVARRLLPPELLEAAWTTARQGSAGAWRRSLGNSVRKIRR